MNTKYFLNLVAGNIFHAGSPAAIPTDYYIGLSKTPPDIEGSNITEPEGGGYARVKISGLSEPADGVVTNGGEIDFPRSESDWGTVSHFVIYDALTDGHPLMFGALTSTRTIEPSTVLTLEAGKLKLSVVNPD